MSYPQDPNMVALTVNRSMRLARCWEILREDGVAFRYTEHDAPLVIGAVTYKPVNSIAGSARRRQQNLQAVDSEVTGFVVDDDDITFNDLRAGRFRNARVTEFVVDWRYPWAGHHIRDVYYVQEMDFDGEKWSANIAGLKSLLRQERGRVLTKTCGHRVYDNRCKLDKADFTYSSTVTAVSNPRRLFKAASLAGVYEDNWFRLGTVTFTSGNNDGVTEEIAGYRDSDGRIQLVLKMTADIEVGDTFDIVVGCNLLFSTCKTKFNNVVNFGGKPYIPGNDAMLRTPNSRVP